MKKIALLSPPYVPFYMRNARCDFVSLSKSQWYPIWLGYLGAYLEGRGFTVKLIDGPAYEMTHDEFERAVEEFKPDFLVVYPGRLSEDNDIAIADKLVSRLGVPGIFVGPYASICPSRLLKKSAKIRLAVEGEFEQAVAAVLEAQPEAGIPGLLRKEGEEIIANPQGALMDRQALDAIPFVSDFFARHLDLNRYSTPSEFHPFLDILGGRGCAWGHCTYCLWVHSFIKGSVYNSRSPENVAQEFSHITRNIPQVRSVMIQDDTITDARGHELAEAFLSMNNTLPWSCYARADLTPKTLKLMKKAGCRNLHVGFESADPTILKNIKKGLTAERMTRFAEDAAKAGLRLHGDFAIGFPGESRKTALATIDWACRMRPHTAQFQLMIPFPGTPFHDDLAAKGWIKNGCANYPGASTEELESLAKKAYRRYYISPWFLWQILKSPNELFFSRLGTYFRAVPSIFWKKYVR
ncbi:MAG: radical SAM protein [Humidesulfovibrio sp.]|nr:radical SAM protein [Humidesulfovibrio sp.]